MSWFEHATAVKQQRQAERLTTVEDLSTRQSAGETIDPAEIVEVCEAAGVSLEDYAETVERKEKRQELARRLATAPALQKRLDDLNEKFLVESARWEKCVKEHDAIVGPIQFEARKTEAELIEARAASDKLRDGYAGPLLDELKEIEGERQQIALRCQDMQSRLDHHQSFLRPGMFTITDSEREKHTRAVADCAAGLAEVRDPLAGLEDREREIDRLMRLP